MATKRTRRTRTTPSSTTSGTTTTPNPFDGSNIGPDASYKPSITVTPQGDVYKYVFSAGSWMSVWIGNIHEDQLAEDCAPPKPGVIPAEFAGLLNPNDTSTDALAARSALSVCNANAAHNENNVFQGWLNARNTYKQFPSQYEEPVSPVPYYGLVNYETAYQLIKSGQGVPPIQQYSWHLRPKR